jgi:hypothetical protein
VFAPALYAPSRCRRDPGRNYRTAIQPHGNIKENRSLSLNGVGHPFLVRITFSGAPSGDHQVVLFVDDESNCSVTDRTRANFLNPECGPAAGRPWCSVSTRRALLAAPQVTVEQTEHR